MTTYCSFPWHASGLKYVCMQTRSGTQGFDGRSGIWGVLFLSDGWRLCCYTDGERKADAGSSRHQEYQGARGQKRMEDRFTEREQHSGDSLGFGGGGCSFQTKKVQNCKEIIIKYNHQISSAPTAGCNAQCWWTWTDISWSPQHMRTTDLGLQNRQSPASVCR